MEFKLKRFEKAIDVTSIANIHYFEFTNRYHTMDDKHSFRELLYVDNGFIMVQAENYSGIVRENQVIIHRSNETHSLSCPEDIGANVIIIGFQCISEELDVFANSPITLRDNQKKLLTEIIKEGRSVFLPPYDVPNQKDMKKRKEYPFGADQMIKLKLENLFIELIRDSKNIAGSDDADISDSTMTEICNYINDNFRNKITLSELCFLFGTNKTTLCKRFREDMGETIISYINKLRIKEAKLLLRGGNFNITQIADEIGFSSVHYFSRIFKQYEKHSPTVYIKTIKSRLML